MLLQAMSYRRRIESAVPSEVAFQPLMTLYLTDNTHPDTVHAAQAAGIVAFKMYPAGSTTNSDAGVTDWKKCLATLKVMEEVRMGMSRCEVLTQLSPHQGGAS